MARLPGPSVNKPAKRNAGQGDTRTGTGEAAVTVLGSTGSVGSNTVSLIALEPERYQVEALTAGVTSPCWPNRHGGCGRGWR